MCNTSALPFVFPLCHCPEQQWWKTNTSALGILNFEVTLPSSLPPLHPFIPLLAVYFFGSFWGPLTPAAVTHSGVPTPTQTEIQENTRGKCLNTHFEALWWGTSSEAKRWCDKSRRRADERCVSPTISACLLLIYVFVCALNLNVFTSVMSSIFPAVTSNSLLPSLCLPFTTNLL